jgi:serine/threonine protein kinase
MNGVPVPSVEGLSNLAAIGHGGFSTVFRAYQSGFDRDVAVKVLSIGVLDARAKRRFERECAVMGRLSRHPNIVTPLFSGFTDRGEPFIVMEYFEHGSLATELHDHGVLQLEEVLRIGAKLCGALESAHRQGVLHRDVKPQNAFKQSYGTPVLGDFGLSIAVERGASISTDALTPEHSAPEVLEGHEPGPASDVYGLGSTLYTMLAGRPAYQATPGEGILPLLLRIAREPLPDMPRTDVGQQTLEILRRAMAKEPSDRYASAAEFASAICVLEHELGFAVTEPIFDAASASREVDEEPPGTRLDNALGEATIHRRRDRPTAPPAQRPGRRRLGKGRTQAVASKEPPASVQSRPSRQTGSGESADAHDPSSTIIRPRRSVEQGDEEPAAPRGVPRIAVVIASCVAGLIAIVAVVALAVGGGNGGSKATTTRSSITGTPQAPAVSATNLSAVRSGSNVLITWNDTNGGHYPYAVQVTDPDGTVAASYLTRNRDTYVLGASQAPVGDCFVVVTEGGTTAAQTPKTAPVCP